MHRAGWILRGLLVVALVADGAVSLLRPDLLAAESAATGFPASLTAPVGILTLICALIYAVPRTAVLGAILVTGFLGGAICTHVRVGEVGTPPELACLVLGLIAWGGLYLSDSRVRALVPVTR